MKNAKPRTFLTVMSLVAVASALSACEVRRDGETGEPQPTATATVSTEAAPPTPSASPRDTVSIIREDIVPVIEVEPPAAPIEVTIPFPDGANISDAAERILVDVLSSEAMDEGWPVVLAGHTDSAGNDQANLRASRARAEAVAAWLVEYGVDDSRIRVIAFGEQNPIAPNALPDGSPNEEGRRRNRRVELRIAPPVQQPASRSDVGRRTAP